MSLDDLLKKGRLEWWREELKAGKFTPREGDEFVPEGMEIFAGTAPNSYIGWLTSRPGSKAYAVGDDARNRIYAVLKELKKIMEKCQSG